MLGNRQLSVVPYLEKKELIRSQLKFNQRRIVVAHLPLKTTDRDLERHFAAFGRLEKAFVVRNKVDPKLLPYGHIIYRSEEGAWRAKKAKHRVLGKRVLIKTHKIDIKKKLQEIREKEEEGL